MRSYPGKIALTMLMGTSLLLLTESKPHQILYRSAGVSVCRSLLLSLVLCMHWMSHRSRPVLLPMLAVQERSPFGSLPLDAEAHELASKLKREFPQLSIYGGSNTNPGVTMRMGVKALQAKGFPNASEKKECKGPSKDYTCSGVRGALGEVVRYLLDIWEAEDSSNLIRGLAEFWKQTSRPNSLCSWRTRALGRRQTAAASRAAAVLLRGNRGNKGSIAISTSGTGKQRKRRVSSQNGESMVTGMAREAKVSSSWTRLVSKCHSLILYACVVVGARSCVG